MSPDEVRRLFDGDVQAGYARETTSCEHGRPLTNAILVELVAQLAETNQHLSSIAASLTEGRR